MSEIEIERTVGAPAATVWEVVTDLDSAAERLSGVEQLERLAGPDFGVGTRWRETRTMFGKRATEEMEVTSVEPGRAYSVLAESHGARYLSELVVEARDGERSSLTMRFDAEPQGLGAKLAAATVGRLFRGATRKALARDLDDIAAAAEAAAGT